MNKFMSFFKRKKFKYGATAIAFTCVIITLIVMFNVIFTAFANKYLWTIDMTTNQLFTLSDETLELFKDVKSDKKITILFCNTYDKLEEEYYSNMIYQCAREFEKEFDFVEIDCFDAISNPDEANKYKDLSTSEINQNSVIVKSETDYRVYTKNGFFETYEDLTAFKGEIRFTSAITQLLYDSPVAYFATGHGENTGAKSNRPALWTLYEDAGYEVKTIDLKTDEFEDNAQVLIVNGPQYDLGGDNSSVNEVEKIGKFLNNGGNLMVLFSSKVTKPLPELNSLLEEWGIKAEEARIEDMENSYQHPTQIDTLYTTNEIGQKIFSSLNTLDSTPRVYIDLARPLTTIWKESITDRGASRGVAPVITSYKTAVAKPYSSEEDAFAGEAPFNVVSISCENYTKDNKTYQSYVMVISSDEFASDKALNDGSYSNRDILYSTMKIMGKETVPTAKLDELFYNDSLTITTKDANNWTLTIAVIIPLIVLVFGVVIQIRRRHL